MNGPMLLYTVNAIVSDDALNALFDVAWPWHRQRTFAPVLEKSLAYVTAHEGDVLVGFVNMAWDGGVHAFILDTTVHPDAQHRGIGTRLVREAAAVARRHGVRWLHVDYESALRGFYEDACGFRPTAAGLLDLSDSGGSGVGG